MQLVEKFTNSLTQRESSANMAITPSWKSSTEATEVEQEYIDKGAVMTPQVNPVVEAKFRAALAEAQAKIGRAHV